MPDAPHDADAPLPKNITDDETIVRGILTPWHYKGGKLRRQAFQPPKGSSELSVMRLLKGADFCKDKAVEIASANRNNKYSGLMSIRADAIRGDGKTKVVDSPDPPNFPGHADITYDFRMPQDGDPPPSQEEWNRIHNTLDALLAKALYRHDPEPLSAGWKGPALKIDAA